MALILYDIETTGLNKRFDQILHFAAIKTDEDLNPVDRFEVKSRLLPNIIPAPAALHVTGLSLADLYTQDRLSHYGMVCAIVSQLRAWGPATFIGFNSIKFDEEFLRHAFFQTLHPPYFTSLNGNKRGDALHLVRATSILAPETLRVPIAQSGNPTFALQALAAANEIIPTRTHDAAADVETTLALCKMIRANASSIWSNFLKFVSKPAVNAFTSDESAFALLDFRSGAPKLSMVTELGRGTTDTNLVHCLDLETDVVGLSKLSAEELSARLTVEQSFFRKFKANGSPMLWAAWDIDVPHAVTMTCDDAEAASAWLSKNSDFKSRLLALAQQNERSYPPSPHPEEQLYEAWIPDADLDLCGEFHAVPWEARAAIAARFADKRLKAFARRLAYFERPDLLSDAQREAMSREFERRVCSHPPAGPWRTIPLALEELQAIVQEAAHADPHVFVEMTAEFKSRLQAFS